MDWENDADVGEYIIIEGYIIVDPSTYTDVWNDFLLKHLATAYIKKQWGANMSKYDDMMLPGGIKMNGKKYYEEAMNEIKELETKIRLEREQPPQWIMG